MGSGASLRRKLVRSNNPVQPLPTLHPLKAQPLKQPHEPPLTTSQVEPEKPPPKPKQKEINWPLPPDEQYPDFRIQWSTDKERYSVKRAYSLSESLSQKKFKSTKITKIDTHHQKETSSSQWKEQNSSIHDSAHVQSSLYTQSHACVNLSTNEGINRLLEMITEVQIDVDISVEEKQKLISETTRKIMEIVTGDTRTIQQTLLGFGQTIQMNQDKLYREWLQMYIIELDQWKSARLARLQERMEYYHRTILTESQRLIMKANTEGNTIKTDLLKIAQHEASVKIQQLIEEIQAMSVNHHLGTETMTKINLIIHGNVGNKMPGQGCTFDFEECDKPDERKEHGGEEKPLAKRDSQKPNQPIVRRQGTVKKRTVEDQHGLQAIVLGHHVQIEERLGHHVQIEEREDMSYAEDYDEQDQYEQ